uniref:Peptidase S1 domain-containing protein n=1 Tax=Dendroctonus ponderosae TaxID=77166 RepID=A0AAR5NY41_DENPD
MHGTPLLLAVLLLRLGRSSRAGEENWIIEVSGNCSCVPYYLCDNTGYIKTDGVGLLDERTGGENPTFCSGGTHEAELVCCKLRPQAPPSTSTVSTSSDLELFKSPRQMRCGMQRTTIDVRLLEGDDGLSPIDGEFPWMAAIYSRDSSRWKRQGSGSLIHPQAVLTAAHAVPRYRKTDFRVIVNGRIQQSEIGTDEEQERAVRAVLRHPNFQSGTLYNDVAVLVLEEPYNLTATPTINTVCLHPNASYVGKRCVVAGWGEASKGLPSSTARTSVPILRKLELPTPSPDNCEEMLQKTYLGVKYQLHESFMCAGGEAGKDACRGDGGSPLVCATAPNETALYQAGIVAFGVGCGKEGIPGVYADATHFYQWIVDTLQKLNITL